MARGSSGLAILGRMSMNTTSIALPARHVLRIGAVAAAFLIIAGCGNKGPLVMPQKPVPVEVPATQEPPPAVQDPHEATQPVDGAHKPTSDSDDHQ